MPIDATLIVAGVEVKMKWVDRAPIPRRCRHWQKISFFWNNEPIKLPYLRKYVPKDVHK